MRNRRYALADPNYVGRLPKRLEWGPAAPSLCAGVTVYKSLKETEVKPGEWVAVSGIGGLGHLAVQYAKAMGIHVAAIDVHPDKLALARKLGAEISISAREVDPAALQLGMAETAEVLKGTLAEEETINKALSGHRAIGRC